LIYLDIASRWIFEALYKWYFERKTDGFVYLTAYQYNSFDRSDIFVVLTNFLVAFNLITMLFLMPEPLWMHRTLASVSGGRSESRDSVTSLEGDGGAQFPPRMSVRETEAVQPVMFMRASTVTGRTSKLSVNMSQMGEENTSRGPTVMLNEISYRVRDLASPLGYKTVLTHISGQFDWGKLTMILGAPQCGKSSLMNIIAGNVGAGAEVSGQVTFNGLEPRPEQPLWERCGYVPMHNEHIRDLTVTEVITFAMKLRCYNSLGLSVVEENVTTTIANLHLAE
jgi:ABC-type multidrug transport system fused ATPase/permease subunit